VLSRAILWVGPYNSIEDAKNQSVLTDEHLKKIVGTFRAFQKVEKYAYRVTTRKDAGSPGGAGGDDD
jgi:type I restriction enzyme M protein